MTWKYYAPLIGCLLVLLGTGCAESKPTGSIQGKATLSGKAIANGKVIFRSPEGMGDDREATITAGEFKIDKLPVGPQRVEISGVKGITAKTLGNGQVVEVKAGDQPLDLKFGS